MCDLRQSHEEEKKIFEGHLDDLQGKHSDLEITSSRTITSLQDQLNEKQTEVPRLSSPGHDDTNP